VKVVVLECSKITDMDYTVALVRINNDIMRHNNFLHCLPQALNELSLQITNFNIQLCYHGLQVCSVVQYVYYRP